MAPVSCSSGPRAGPRSSTHHGAQALHVLLGWVPERLAARRDRRALGNDFLGLRGSAWVGVQRQCTSCDHT